jgi:2-polyprenyl-3-methyl-5-hydroxy-6-metoxy-1,4-benzoquinol methylase
MLNKKKIKFGKSFKDVDKIKSNFFSQNLKLLRDQNKINNLYRSQPKRRYCKACEKKLKGEFFINHKTKFIQCKNCSHINGTHEDTNKFANKIYIDEKVSYSKSYYEKNVKDFKLRQKKIYDPKVNFLKNNFKDHTKIKVLDIGAGSGYFVASLLDKKFKDAIGLEVSKNQIEFGKKIFKHIRKNPNKIQNTTYEDLKKHIKNTDFNCISLIGVLEHLVDMSEIMQLIKKNKKIKYLYVLVPMFSLICTIESIFSNVFNRHLGGGHTHLFTERSLKDFMFRFGFREHASWWFGTDMHDLFRSFIIQTQEKKFKPLEKMTLETKNLIDNLQLEFDKKKLCSEVHMLLKRK